MTEWAGDAPRGPSPMFRGETVCYISARLRSPCQEATQYLKRPTG